MQCPSHEEHRERSGEAGEQCANRGADERDENHRPAADAIEKAVMKITKEKLESLSAGKMGYSTSEVGDLVADLVV